MFESIFIIILVFVVYRFVSKGRFFKQTPVKKDSKTGQYIEIDKDGSDPHYDKEREDKELKLKNKNLNLNLDSKRQEKKIAKIVKNEIDNKKYDEVIWLRAFKKAKGNKEEAQALYAEYRAEELERVYYLKNDTSDDMNVNEKNNYDSKKISKSNDHTDKNQLNILIFSIVYFLSILFGYTIADYDLNFQNLLGHRSIITHSILIPWLIYFYSKDKKSKYLFTIIMGLFISFSVHLIYDFIPKGWAGNAFIKFPGNISIGFLSIPWIALNALVSMYLGQKILFNYFNERKYKVLIVIITTITSFLFARVDRNDEELKFILFLIVFFSFFFYKIINKRYK